MQGAAWALERIETVGLDQAKEEFKRRGAFGIPLRVTQQDERRFSEAIRMNVLDTILIMALVVLHDEFGFGTQRLNRFKARYNFKAESMVEDPDIKWSDMKGILLEECNIDLPPVRWVDGVDPSEVPMNERKDWKCNGR